MQEVVAPWSITRHGEPSKHDHAPYGSVCKVVKGNKLEIYVQRSSSDENPLWDMIGEYTEQTPSAEIENAIRLIVERIPTPPQ